MNLDYLRLVGAHSRRRLVEMGESLRRRDGSWAVVAGAGISQDAGLPGWLELILAVTATHNVPCDRDAAPETYPDLLDRCLSGASEAVTFWSQIRDLLCSDVPSGPLHRMVVSLPFEAYATTNLDCLFEAVHEELPDVANPRVVSYPNLLTREIAARRLVYLHGRCPCQGPPDLSDELAVLTRSAYDEAYSEASMLPLAIQHLFTSYRVLLVGSSMSDPDFSQVVGQARRRAEGVSRQGADATDSRLQEGIHRAIVATEKEEAGEELDWHFGGKRYGIEPIFYFNPPGSGHAALTDIMNWLTEAVQPAPEAGDGVDDLAVS